MISHVIFAANANDVIAICYSDVKTDKAPPDSPDSS